MRLAIRDGRLCLLAVRKEEAKARRKEKLQTENMSYFLKMGRGDTLLRWLCLLLFAFNVLEGSSSSRSWWCTGKPGMLRPLGSQRVRHDWATEPNWTEGSSRTDLWGGWVVTENTEAQVILMFWGLIIDSQLLQKSLCASSVTQGWRPAFASRFVSKRNLWLRNPSR